ncbi:MAG: class I SAM-dependent methyltransferase [Alphaproteobacteria bacterium]|nr:class I SAM-dependent methyltransferase [Alphaproteobacteria bacterium]
MARSPTHQQEALELAITIFDSLPPAEKARQLANPEGEIGLAVAEFLNGNNRSANTSNLARLGLTAGQRVLEIGFGNGRAAADVLASSDKVQYAGIDISPTMVAEAVRFNAPSVAAGRATFHLGAADQMPFPDASFYAIFSSGVIHFWPDPDPSLRDLHRVLRPGGLSVHSCIDPRTAPPFALAEPGFHLRPAAEWDRLFRAAGFAEVAAEAVERDQLNSDGTPTKRYSVRVTARA